MTDLSKTFGKDKFGTELHRLQRHLRDNCHALMAKPDVANRVVSKQAYESGLKLLPELWRLEQRK